MLHRWKLAVFGKRGKMAAGSISRLVSREGDATGDKSPAGQPMQGLEREPAGNRQQQQQGSGLTGVAADTAFNFDKMVQTHLLLAEAVSNVCV